MKIGVLAIQGDFREHIHILNKLKVDTCEVRKAEQLKDLYGLIIPGGESTTIIKLLKKYGLDKDIKKAHKEGMSIYGTCAGAIILSKNIIDPKTKKISTQPTLKILDMNVSRNSYGRQIDSFEEDIIIKGLNKKYPAIFIRAPKFESIPKGAEILATYKDQPVMIRKNNILVSAFHPELTEDTRVHELFINIVKESLIPNANK